MISFATEFPITPISEGSFIAQVVSWLRGTTYSTVLDDPAAKDLAGDSAHIQSSKGEELRLRRLDRDGGFEAIGFRHDFPDNEGRLWRTEAVLRRSASGDDQDVIRIRTQSIARKSGVRLDAPRKPYLIKSMLLDKWGGTDRKLPVTDQPIWLDDDAASLEIARAITCGEGTDYLPVVYVSAVGSSEWLPTRDRIQKLSYDLGGVAHVVAEPNRAFSFRLRDLVAGSNAYGGTIAIALPGRGMVRRFFLGIRLADIEDLLSATRKAALDIRSQMPAVGWEWTELQEQVLRRQREQDQRRLNHQETIELYEEEVNNLKDRISQLEAQITARAEDADEIDEGLLPANFVEKVGREIYEGEFSDRLRLAVRQCARLADQINLDKRSKAVLEAMAPQLPLSAAHASFLDDLKRVTKDPRRVASEVTSLLERHGYREKSDNKHIRLQAKEGFLGLEPITVPKTPSDGRGLLNLRKQIERTLGLGKLIE